MTIEIVATINSDGAKRGAAQLNSALASSSGHVKRFDSSILSVNRALGLLGGFMAVRTLVNAGKAAISAADDFTRLEARLNAIGTGGYTAQQVMDAVGDAANRARVPVNDLTDVYARNAAALGRLGYSQSEAVRIAETLSKLGTLSGGSAQSVSAAMFQLSQAFNSGTFRGEEFNSVAEQTPEVLRALSDATGKSAGELRKLAAEGKITAETVADAMLYVSHTTDERFGKMGSTVEQSLTLLSNSVTTNWGKISKEMNVTGSWVSTINDLTKALELPVAKNIMRDFAFGLTWIADAAKSGLGYLGQFVSYIQELRDARIASDAAGGDLASIDSISYKNALLNGSGGGRRRGGIRNGKPVTGAATGTVPTLDVTGGRPQPTFGKGTSDDSEAKRIERVIERTRELSAVEDLRNAVTTARLNGEHEVARQLERQIELEQRITPEMEKHAPLLVAELRQRIENGYELERQLETQSELIERNKQFAEDMASTLTDGFKRAITEGNSFSETLRNVASQLMDVVAQAALFDPLKKNLTDSISGSLGSTDLGSMFSGFSLGGFGFAKGGVLSSPASFTSGGMRGVAGEAGPEALMPLKRGADGSLGVVAQGGGSGSQVINISIAGDATDATVEKLRAVARQEFTRLAPGVVRDSVSAVRREHVRDTNYLRR